MELIQFQNEFSSRGLNVQGSNAYGEMNGFPFFIQASGAGTSVTFMTVYFSLETPAKRKALKVVKKELAPIGLVAVDDSVRNRVFFRANANVQDAAGAMQNAIYKLTMAFMANGYRASYICPICKQAGCDSMALIGTGYVNTHRACVEGNYIKTLQETNENENKGFNVLALIGALLGAIVGSIPTILTILFANSIYAILYALIPIASFYGYKLMKGYMGKQVYPIVIICSVLMLPFMELMTWIFAIHQEYGIWLTAGETIALYFEAMTGGDILKSFAFPVIFMALGIFVACRNFVHTNEDFKHDADSVMRSLIVRQPQQNAQAQQPAYAQAQQPVYQQPTQPVYEQQQPTQPVYQQPVQPQADENNSQNGTF